MPDPYEVLGIPRNASNDEIKAAYRKMARKYHPDNYVDSPKADAAADKMKQINAAYESITRGEATASGYNGGYSGGREYHQGDAERGTFSYRMIRQLIDAGYISDADSMLERMDSARRDAQWHYLKGHIYTRRGWLEQAVSSFETAHNMEPNNFEYAQALNRMRSRRQGGNPFGRERMGGGAHMRGCSMSEICTVLCCLNMCCGGRFCC